MYNELFKRVDIANQLDLKIQVCNDMAKRMRKQPKSNDDLENEINSSYDVLAEEMSAQREIFTQSINSIYEQLIEKTK